MATRVFTSKSCLFCWSSFPSKIFTYFYLTNFPWLIIIRFNINILIINLWKSFLLIYLCIFHFNKWMWLWMSTCRSKTCALLWLGIITKFIPNRIILISTIRRRIVLINSKCSFNLRKVSEASFILFRKSFISDRHVFCWRNRLLLLLLRFFPVWHNLFLLLMICCWCAFCLKLFSPQFYVHRRLDWQKSI